MDSPADADDLQHQEMTVYLQVKKTVVMKVRGSEKIRSIKSAFYDKEGICENNQELFINGDQLKDDQTVVDCGIREGNTLHLVLQNNTRVKLLVAVPSEGKRIVIEARTYHSIANIKYIILEKEGIQPNQYSLFHSGIALEDNRTLSSLGMQNESATLLLVFNPSDMVSFSVVTPTGRTVQLNVKVLYSVADVKEIVGGLIGMPVSQYGLVYQRKQLEEFKSLAYYGIKEGSVLQMSYLKFQIFVKPWSGGTITVDVQQCDTIEVVRNRACKKLGSPNYFCSVIFSGKRLKLKHDLAYYKIQKNATLHMVLSPSTVTTYVKFSDIGGRRLGVPESATTIRGLKAMIRKMIDSPVKEIYFRGRPLEDSLTIGHYKINANERYVVVSDNINKQAEE